MCIQMGCGSSYDVATPVHLLNWDTVNKQKVDEEARTKDNNNNESTILTPDALLIESPTEALVLPPLTVEADSHIASARKSRGIMPSPSNGWLSGNVSGACSSRNNDSVRVRPAHEPGHQRFGFGSAGNSRCASPAANSIRDVKQFPLPGSVEQP